MPGSTDQARFAALFIAASLFGSAHAQPVSHDFNADGSEDFPVSLTGFESTDPVTGAARIWSGSALSLILSEGVQPSDRNAIVGTDIDRLEREYVCGLIGEVLVWSLGDDLEHNTVAILRRDESLERLTEVCNGFSGSSLAIGLRLSGIVATACSSDPNSDEVRDILVLLSTSAYSRSVDELDKLESQEVTAGMHNLLPPQGMGEIVLPSSIQDEAVRAEYEPRYWEAKRGELWRIKRDIAIHETKRTKGALRGLYEDLRLYCSAEVLQGVIARLESSGQRHGGKDFVSEFGLESDLQAEE